MPVSLVIPRVDSKLGEVSRTNQRTILKSMLHKKKTHVFCLINKHPAGLHHTEVRIGDAHKPTLSIQSTDKITNKSGNQPQINHRNYPPFLSLNKDYLRTVPADVFLVVVALCTLRGVSFWEARLHPNNATKTNMFNQNQ